MWGKIEGGEERGWKRGGRERGEGEWRGERVWGVSLIAVSTQTIITSAEKLLGTTMRFLIRTCRMLQLPWNSMFGPLI